MSINDFLPIADAPGANVQLQAAYAANPNRTAFYADGTVPDADEHGKMFRQCSVVASQFMQMLADYSGLDMLDDGNLAVLLANMKTQFRIRLSATRNFYVATAGNGGSDANDGLTPGTPWLTVQHAISVVAQAYDLNGNGAIINVGAGTFAGFSGVGVPGQGVITSVVPLTINGAGPTTIFNSSISATTGSVIRIQNCAVANPSDYCFYAQLFGYLLLGAGISITAGPAAPAAHIGAAAGGIVQIENSMTISAGGGALILVNGGGQVFAKTGVVITFSGAISFGNATISATTLGQASIAAITFAGTTPTATRYSVSGNGVIYTGGAGATFIPGTSAGTSATGGQYT